MELSIIIVNYNVKFFLEQCLYAVLKAVEQIDAEIWVVDNRSTDGSVEYLRPLFPGVSFLENQKNAGFSAANNQALQLCSGSYILFLNPDTLIPEDCLTNCIQFMKAHSMAGALGIRMLDGSGKFLPESKRAFPSPIRAFYKLIGFSALFPKSSRFNRYSLGHLNSFKNHEVDVLAGAFMMIPKSVLELTGGFDERFFMFGEEAELCFRLKKNGFKIKFVPESKIIHFGGASASKSNNQVKVEKMVLNGTILFFKLCYDEQVAKKAKLLYIIYYLRYLPLRFFSPKAFQRLKMALDTNI